MKEWVEGLTAEEGREALGTGEGEGGVGVLCRGVARWRARYLREKNGALVNNS